MRRLALVVLVVAAGALSPWGDRVRRAAGRADGTPTPAAQTIAATPNPSTDQVFICPMDRDIRSYKPGFCPRCKIRTALYGLQ